MGAREIASTALPDPRCRKYHANLSTSPHGLVDSSSSANNSDVSKVSSVWDYIRRSIGRLSCRGFSDVGQSRCSDPMDVGQSHLASHATHSDRSVLESAGTGSSSVRGRREFKPKGAPTIQPRKQPPIVILKMLKPG